MSLDKFGTYHSGRLKRTGHWASKPVEPFRMERTGLPSGGVESTPEVECSLEDLWVEFERGVSLHPLLPPPITKPRVDPLANLLTRSPGRLSPGTAGRLLLWGPAPEGSGVLHGLGQPLPLAQDTVRRLPQTGGQLQPHARGDD